MLDSLSKNLALASTLLTAISIVVSTTFLYTYIRAFDPIAFWFVEYTDILKGSIIALAIILAYTGTIGVGMSLVFSFIDETSTILSKVFWSIMLVMLVLLSISAFLTPIKSESERDTFLTDTFIGVFYVAFPTVMAIRWYKKRNVLPIICFGAVFFAILATQRFASAAATLRSSTNEFYSIVRIRKDQPDSIDHAKLVAVLSKYVVIQRDKRIIALDASDVKEIRREASP